MKLRLARLMGIGLAASAGLTIGGATPGLAQFVGGSGSGPTNIQSQVQKNIQGAQHGVKQEIQPPVLPGTKAPIEPAEPSAATVDLAPTDALFDAINRGDLGAAREAINRGAELNGRNLLGMTPLELSVDLGRNNISFLLLSMRGDDGSVRRIVRGQAEQREREAMPAPRAGRSRVIAASTGPAEEPTAATPRLYSGNGGTAIPAAGFLGFDRR